METSSNYFLVLLCGSELETAEVIAASKDLVALIPAVDALLNVLSVRSKTSVGAMKERVEGCRRCLAAVRGELQEEAFSTGGKAELSHREGARYVCH